MHVLQTSRHACAWISSSVHDVTAVMMLCLVEQSLDARLRETPGTSVERLFLTPHYRFGVGVRVEVLLQLCPWEWVELLDARDGCFAHTLFGAVFLERNVHLAGTEDYALDLVVGIELAVFVTRIRDDPLEVGVAGELAERGAGEWVTKKSFTEEENQSYDC
jgi:hypothetical protein